jgi:hypothetical protein
MFANWEFKNEEINLKQENVSARRKDVSIIHIILVAFNWGFVGVIVCRKLAVRFNIEVR